MSSKPIEFRYLHFVTNAVAGDRTTVGLMHWDGVELRFAHSLARIAEPPSHLERAVDSLADRVLATQKGLGSGPFLFGQELDKLFPCQTRGGDALVWSAVRRGFSANAEGHFADLVAMLGLVRAQSAPAERLSNSVLRAALEDLALEFSGQPELVQARRDVVGHYHYRSPLSWKNGVWNHTIPLSLDVVARSEMEAHVRDALARGLTSIPADEAPVLVAGMPSAANDVALAEGELAFMRTQLGARARIAKVQRGLGPDLGSLRTMIRDDISVVLRTAT